MKIIEEYLELEEGANPYIHEDATHIHQIGGVFIKLGAKYTLILLTFFKLERIKINI